MNLLYLVGESFLLRVVIICASYYVVDLYLSRYHQWYYTDIDYFIYSDAGKLLLNGNSPYDRITYRYPPILSGLMTFNHLVHPVIGKFMFSLFDALTAYEIFRIQKQLGASTEVQLFGFNLWAWNPISIYICTRGSCDSISNYLILLTFRLLLSFPSSQSRGILFSTGVVYGFLIWLRLYPIIYFPLFLCFIFGSSIGHWKTKLSNPFLFLFSFSFSIILNGIRSYRHFGEPYLNESLLYHLSRLDHRHNFSSYFYQIYLGKSFPPSSLQSPFTSKVLNYLPLLLLFVIFFLLMVYFAVIPHFLKSDSNPSRKLFHGLFLQTFVFVIFNKVITGQYFLWFLIFIPILIPTKPLMSTTTLKSIPDVVLGFSGVGITGLLWLFIAYFLELQGVNTFKPLWIASLLFLIANVIFAHILLQRLQI
jgi:phosphatidylinositol glycan class M